ncbi:hypothetical protein [Pedococcus sp.]|uniref:hypothetical protein n=1 Tax=Pedococcus sp. TaxID=2860345 RepID=UPI002E0D3E06|nr:hypothetical protein [Pedococcus sp.]
MRLIGAFPDLRSWSERDAGAGRRGQAVGGELTNLLTAYAAGAAGRAHPSRPNLASLHEFRGDPVAAALGTQ